MFYQYWPILPAAAVCQRTLDAMTSGPVNTVLLIASAVFVYLYCTWLVGVRGAGIQSTNIHVLLLLLISACCELILL